VHLLLGARLGGSRLVVPLVAAQAGAVPAEFLQRLEEWRADLWDPIVTFGFHECPFCKGEPKEGGANFWVPGTARRWFSRRPCIFVMPELALHYMTAHGYCPPQEFINAVRESPAMSSPEFFDQVRALSPKLFPPPRAREGDR
jgi:hypothetical protein